MATKPEFAYDRPAGQTADAARAMGVEREVGTVVAGKRADVIAVAGDPLRHNDVLRQPRVVIARGRRYR